MCVGVEAGRTPGEPHNPILASCSTILAAALTEPSSSGEGRGRDLVTKGSPAPFTEVASAGVAERTGIGLALGEGSAVKNRPWPGPLSCATLQPFAGKTQGLPPGGLAWKQPRPLIPHPHRVEAQALKQFLNFSLGFMCLRAITSPGPNRSPSVPEGLRNYSCSSSLLLSPTLWVSDCARPFSLAHFLESLER